MKIEVKAGRIENQTLIEKVERGDVLISRTTTSALDDEQRKELLQTFLRNLQSQLDDLPGAGLSTPLRREITRDTEELARAVAAGTRSLDLTDRGASTRLNSCFISYASQDYEFVQRLYVDLQNHAVRCWFAHKDMSIGDKIRERIDEVISLHDKVLLVLSGHSGASDWVQEEVETAFRKERKSGKLVLFPIRIGDGCMDSARDWVADIRRSRHIGDFSRWKEIDAYQVALERLLSDLQTDGDVG